MKNRCLVILAMFLIFYSSISHVDKVCADELNKSCEVDKSEEINIVTVVEETTIEDIEETSIIAEPIIIIDESEVELLANVLFGEARGIKDKSHQAAVLWCVLNRVDSDKFPNSIYDVLSAPKQFGGFNLSRKYSERELPILEKCKELARDVLYRYHCEKLGLENIGRTLPNDYFFFYGKNGENHFTKEWRKYDTLWNWTLTSPY